MEQVEDVAFELAVLSSQLFMLFLVMLFLVMQQMIDYEEWVPSRECLSAHAP